MMRCELDEEEFWEREKVDVERLNAALNPSILFPANLGRRMEGLRAAFNRSVAAFSRCQKSSMFSSHHNIHAARRKASPPYSLMSGN
jgi:hypothetical protein